MINQQLQSILSISTNPIWLLGGLLSVPVTHVDYLAESVMLSLI